MSPTAVILVRLAGAFDLTLAGLLLRAEGEGQRLSRAADQPMWRDPATGYLRRQVFSRPDHPIEVSSRAAGRATRRPAGRLPTPYPSGDLGASGRAGRPGGRRPRMAWRRRCLGFGPPAEVTLANETAGPAPTRRPGPELEPCRKSFLVGRAGARADALGADALGLSESSSRRWRTAVRSASCTRCRETTARAFWDEALAAADRGERVVLGAWDGGGLGRHGDAAARTARPTSRTGPKSPS